MVLKMFIFDIFYTLGLHHNLLSTRQLSKKGYNISMIPNEDRLWDMHFEHFHLSGLNYLSRKEHNFGLPIVNVPNRVGETYKIGKKHRELFPIEKSWRKTKY
ncbi:hypothetical protein CR513_47003, partial [Mucuna pruriens]